MAADRHVRRRWAAVGLGVGIAVTCSALARTREPIATPVLDPRVAGDLLAADLRAQWMAVETRARTLAAMPRLVAASTTDAATVQDLTSDELGFEPLPDETVELAQIVDGKPVSLIRVPPLAAGLANAPARLGETFAVVDGRLRFAYGAPLGERAVLAVARTLDPAAALPSVTRSGATLVVGEAGTTPPEWIAVAVAVASTPATLQIPTTSRTPTAVRGLYGAAIGALVLGLGLALVPRRRRDEPAIVVERADPVEVGPSDSVRAVIAHGAGRLGRYETLELIGRGGSSSVYLAHAVGEAGFERRVAVKILRPELTEHPQVREMFFDEARLASRIDHPNVVQTYDLGRTDDGYYIAMEHVDGTDLATLLYHVVRDDRRFPLDIALAIVRRVCDGLHAAHTAIGANAEPMGLVHRDVKPANVMVSRNGAVKIGDFGIAKARQQLHRTALGETKGTLGLMAPEQRLGMMVDARADVFGVGALAYELVTGLEVDLDLDAALARGTTGWPHLRGVRDARDDAPIELEAILWRALAYSPDSRQASCAELEAELAVVIDAHGWSATDRELAEWVTAELARRTPIPLGAAYVAAAPSSPTPS